MPEMPTLGTPEKKTPVAQVAIVAAVAGTIAGMAYWVTHKNVEPTPAPSPEPVVAQAPVEPAAAPVAAPAVAPTPEAGPAAPAPLSPVVTQPKKAGIATLSTTITGPLETAIVKETSRDVGGPLTQVINRSLVWWLKVPGDLVKGDTLSAVYETREGQEPVVHAVRYTSRKFGKTFEAYRYQPASATHSAFYQPDGTTLEEQLADPPIDDYEQITSLLRDGRKHQGVDFKAPVGTPVRATFDGVVTRKNWHFKGNGNSIEIEESGGKGRTAMFLHLSELPASIKPGDRVKRGQVIAKSGNTGRSFAPHLHYQLMSAGKAIDPFESHATSRASLPAAARPDFEAAVAKLKAQLPSETAASVAGGAHQ